MEEMQFNEPRQMPVLAIRGISVFPGTMLTFDVERPASKAALHAAMGKDQILFLTAQKDASVDEPTAEDLYEVGTICRVKQALRTPGTKIVRVLVDGLTRGYMRGLHQENNCNYAEVVELPDAPETEPILTEALLRRCTGLFTEYAETTGTVSQEAFLFVMTNQEPALVADVIAQSIYLKPEEKQQLLEETMPSRRLGLLKDLLDNGAISGSTVVIWDYDAVAFQEDYASFLFYPVSGSPATFTSFKLDKVTVNGLSCQTLQVTTPEAVAAYLASIGHKTGGFGYVEITYDEEAAAKAATEYYTAANGKKYPLIAFTFTCKVIAHMLYST